MSAIQRIIRVSAFSVFYTLVFCAGASAQSSGEFLGIKLRPEIQSIVKEIERKAGEKIYAEFIEQEDYQLGSSYVSEEGVPVVLVDFSLQDDKQKLEAVIAHELLHLRLRVNNFPAFIFSPTIQTSKGRAIDTEQSNINDLRNLIEHRVFKAEMERFGLAKFINLAGDTVKIAKRSKGKEDGQMDSINYARAILEYPNAADIEAVRRAYEANRWTRALADGAAIADIISRANPQTAQTVETVFLQCLLKLYPTPPTHTFKLTVDPENRIFRQLIVSTARKSGRKNK